jgi:hypothetical protein
VASLENGAHERILVAVNFSERTVAFTMPDGSSSGKVLLSTDARKRGLIWDPRRVQLGPEEGVVVRFL